MKFLLFIFLKIRFFTIQNLISYFSNFISYSSCSYLPDVGFIRQLHQQVKQTDVHSGSNLQRLHGYQFTDPGRPIDTGEDASKKQVAVW